jgi:aryl-alcohol dehydrogenase-like predicted oxidoreductase
VPKDYRAHLPRFQGENLERNLKLVAALEELASKRNVTAAQLAIAWVASRGQDIIPLVGIRRLARLDEALAAVELELDDDELAALEKAVPPDAVAGTRYDQMGMRLIDG